MTRTKTLTVLMLTSIFVTNAGMFERKDQRIVGGDAAPSGRFPFYGQYAGRVVCGSTLIHDDIVIGSARCGVPTECGLFFNSIDSGRGTFSAVDQYVIHPQFNENNMRNDIFVMKLFDPPGVWPIGYNRNYYIPHDGQALTTIGFGATSEGGPLSNFLLQVTVNSVSNGYCRELYHNQEQIPDELMICAGAPYKDSCHGDSGGPLFTTNDGTGDIAGIASWGYGCARSEPGVYTRVSQYEQWIEEAICCMSRYPPSYCRTTYCSAGFGLVSNCSYGNYDDNYYADDDYYGIDDNNYGRDDNYYNDDNYNDDNYYTNDNYPTDDYFGDHGSSSSSDEDSEDFLDVVSDTASDVFYLNSGVCLSPDATTLVETKGKVSIKDVFVGDKVMTGSGKYKTVFTISHSHPDQLTSFLSVQTNMKENPLEVTPMHMLFLQGKPSPIPAKDVKIGDVVQTLNHGPQEVTNVTVVTRNGFYNPVTTDGTIVVDGIIASTYTSLNGGSYLEIAGRKWISFQSLFDMIASPFRAFCTTVSLDFCVHYQVSVVDSMIQFYEFLLQQSSIGQLFLFFAFASLFSLANIILSPVGLLAILVFIGIMVRRCVSFPHSFSMYQEKI